MSDEISVFDRVCEIMACVRPTNESLRAVPWRVFSSPKSAAGAEILCGRCEESIRIPPGYLYRAGPFIHDHADCGRDVDA